MVVLLFLLTVGAFIAVDLVLRRREEGARVAPEASGARLPSLAVAEPPGGLFVHSGHAWAKVDSGGGVQVGLDGFARGVLGRVDGFALPAEGSKVRAGEAAFAALQGGKRIEFVSPVEGEVCAVNAACNADPDLGRKDPYGAGWAFSVRPSHLSRDLKRLRIGSEAAEWLRREVRSFTEFLVLHRAVPAEVGVTLADGGTHAEGVLETMDGEILQIATRRYFR